MPYVLLAIGALMSAAGAYLILTGSHIVQVEAGWTSVIAGATLFAGGILTIGLGLVLRALTQLRSAMIGIPASLPSEPLSSFALQSVAAALASPPPDAIAVVPEAVVPTTQPRKVEPSLGEWRRKKDAAPVSAAVDAPPPLAPVAARDLDRPDEAPDPVTAAEEAEGHEPAFAEVQAPATSAPAALGPAAHSPASERSEPEVSEAAVHTAPLDETVWDHAPVDAIETPAAPYEPETPMAASVRPKDDYELEMPSTSEHDIETRPVAAPVPREPPVSPPIDDWLDRAFAEFDQDLPKVAPEKPPARGALFRRPGLPKATMPPASPPPPPVLEPAYTDPEPAYAETAAAHAEPDAASTPPVGSAPAEPPLSPTRPLTVPTRPSTTVSAAPAAVPAEAATISEEAAPAPASAPPGPVATIIGRYEADGTSYVMYSDGSIEAQSDSGIYRFASMAELKAFIER